MKKKAIEIPARHATPHASPQIHNTRRPNSQVLVDSKDDVAAFKDFTLSSVAPAAAAPAAAPAKKEEPPAPAPAGTWC